MQYGPQELALLPPAEKRGVLEHQFPTWFDQNRQFVREGFLAWAGEHTPLNTKMWLGLLEPHEIASVTNTYQIWHNIYTIKNDPRCFQSVRDWIKSVLPFWLNHDKFDAIGFATWYQYADFKDQEEVFKHLNLQEQKDILRIWAFRKTIAFQPAYNDRNLEWPEEAPDADLTALKAPLFLNLKF